MLESVKEMTYRIEGSLTRQLSTTSLKAREYLKAPASLSSLGGSSFILFQSALVKIDERLWVVHYVLSKTLCGDSLDLGGRPCVSSRALIPKLHMSADESYCLP